MGHEHVLDLFQKCELALGGSSFEILLRRSCLLQSSLVARLNVKRKQGLRAVCTDPPREAEARQQCLYSRVTSLQQADVVTNGFSMIVAGPRSFAEPNVVWQITSESQHCRQDARTVKDDKPTHNTMIAFNVDCGHHNGHIVTHNDIGRRQVVSTRDQALQLLLHSC